MSSFPHLAQGAAVTENLKRRSVRAGAFSLAAQGVDFVLRLGSTAILARLLVPEHFGLIGMVTVITSIGERFKDLGLSTATIQQKEVTPEEVTNLFWVNAAVGVAMTLVVAALARPLALFYDDARLGPITLGIATSFLWSGLAVQHQALLRRQMKFSRIAVVQIISTALSVTLAIVLARLGVGYWALVVRDVSRNLFTAIGTWVCLPWIPGAPSRATPVGSMLRFGSDVTGFNLIYYLCRGMDQLLIGKVLGTVQLGMFRQASQLVLAPIGQLTDPVQFVATSALSRLQGDQEKYVRYYQKIVTALSMVTMPLAVFLVVYAEEAVLLALGSQWVDATRVFRILAVAAFLRSALSTCGFVMITCGHSRQYLKAGFVGSLLIVMFFIVGIQGGIEGVALSHVAFTYTFGLVMLFWAYADTPVRVRDFVVATGRPLAASLLMGGLLQGVKFAAFSQGALATFAVGAALAAPLYLTLHSLLPGGKAELTQLVSDLTSSFGLFGSKNQRPAAS
jgi:PST family polysaccharide transporter